MPDTAYLVLENGAVFNGQYFGTHGEVTGEMVFTTGAFTGRFLRIKNGKRRKTKCNRFGNRGFHGFSWVVSEGFDNRVRVIGQSP